IPGMQVVVCGPAGAGKSNLVYNVLRQAKMKSIVSCCTEKTTIDSLIADGFDKLPAKYMTSRKKRRWAIIAAHLWARQASAGPRQWPFYQTPQRLGEVLAMAGIIWVVEDFHLVAEEERQKMLQVLKVFSDLSDMYKNPKLVVLGTGLAALELFYYDADMANRIAEVNLPYMSKAEMGEIISRGEQLLNLSFSVKLRKALIRYANSLPGIMHELCFLLCMSKGAWKKRSRTVPLNETELLEMVDTWLSMHKFAGETIARAIDLPGSVNMRRLLELLAKTDQNGLTVEAILHHGDFRDAHATQLQSGLDALGKAGQPPLLLQYSYSDAYSFADPYMKAYALMFFERKKYADLLLTSCPSI
ncbi:MAG TPA: hypothetical protein VLD19_14240, partial [Chitinophagaceae bacterium]|nr:hypothetical protein [Chitinophagaceae bacterium]